MNMIWNLSCETSRSAPIDRSSQSPRPSGPLQVLTRSSIDAQDLAILDERRHAKLEPRLHDRLLILVRGGRPFDLRGRIGNREFNAVGQIDTDDLALHKFGHHLLVALQIGR